MTSSKWSGSPFPREVMRHSLTTQGEPLGSGGETSGVFRLAAPRDAWVFKPYLTPVRPDRLNRLSALPGQLSAADRRIVDASTAWPVSCVMGDDRWCVGVILPAAPDAFWTSLRLSGGKTRRQILAIDLLARNADRQNRVGLPGQSLVDRLTVCASLTNVAALFERTGLVYLDWSFSNVLWSVLNHQAYVIDLDGASFGPRRQIGTTVFDDPLVDMGELAGVEVDRYRVALLVAWCLTGMSPDLDAMHDELVSLAAGIGRVAGVANLLRGTLESVALDQRVEIRHLQAALLGALLGTSALTAPSTTGSAPTSVKGWKPIDRDRRGAQVNLDPRSAPHQPPSVPAPSGTSRGAPPPVTWPTQAPTWPPSWPPPPAQSPASTRPAAPAPSTPSNPTSTASGGGCLVFLLTVPIVLVVLVVFLARLG